MASASTFTAFATALKMMAIPQQQEKETSQTLVALLGVETDMIVTNIAMPTITPTTSALPTSRLGEDDFGSAVEFSAS